MKEENDFSFNILKILEEFSISLLENIFKKIDVKQIKLQ